MKALYFRSVPDDIHGYVTDLANETGRTMTDVVIILLTRCRAEGVIVPRKMPSAPDRSPAAEGDARLPRRRPRLSEPVSGAEGRLGG
jgi:hypothetical protein